LAYAKKVDPSGELANLVCRRSPEIRNRSPQYSK